MICPKCGAEYQPGFTRCSDCQVDLVDPSQVPASESRPRSTPEVVSCLAASEAPGWRPVLRWLLAAVLACFVILRVYGTVRFVFLLADQSASYYIVSAIIDLGPAAVEAVAVVFALRGRGGRAAWSILLACGLALLAVQSYGTLTTGGLGYGNLEGVALVALALVQFPRAATLSTRPCDPTGHEVAHS
jgi:hypothetical protein